MNKFTVSESHSQGGVLCNCWMDSERGGRAVLSFDSHIAHSLSWFCSWHLSVDYVTMHQPHFNRHPTLLFYVVIWNFISFFVSFSVFVLLIHFFFPAGKQVAHFATVALTFIHNTLLCFHKWIEHSFHPICFRSDSLRRLKAHYCLVRQGV